MAIIYYTSHIILGLTNEINKLTILLDQQNSYMELPSFCQGEDNPHKICAIFLHFIHLFIYSFHSHALQIFEGSHHIFFPE